MLIYVRRLSEKSDNALPYVVLCSKCFHEVGRVSTDELTGLQVQGTEVLCFDCENENITQGGDKPVLHTLNERAPWPTITLIRRMLATPEELASEKAHTSGLV